MLTAESDRSVACARSLCELLRYTREMIESFSLSGGAILGGCEARLLEGCGYRLQKRPESFAELFEGCEIGDAECARLFGEFCQSFGRGYRAEQLRRCEHCLSALVARAELLSTESASRKKIITAATLSGALMLAILLA